MGGFSFAAPLLLAGLIALPLIWFLLRQSPPPPRAVQLPTLKLIAAEAIPPPQAARPPWWLLALRLLIIALIIGALAGPRWQQPPTGPQPTRLTIVIDNGWAATRWPEMMAAAKDRVEALAAAGTRFVILTTAARRSDDPQAARFVDADTALSILGGLKPQPWNIDRAKAAEAIPRGGDVLWLSDGVESPGADALRTKIGNAEITAFLTREPVFRAGGRTVAGYAATLVRPADGPDEKRVEILGNGGEVLASDTALFDGAATVARITVPPARRSAIDRVRAGTGPASLMLVDGNGGRPNVALVDGGGDAPPLESGEFYIRRALEPHAELSMLSLADAAASDANLFLLPDVAATTGGAAALLERVQDGAVAISFAGPRLAENGSALSPVDLRKGARAFGGVMSWQEPQIVGSFTAGTPLAGLPRPDDATVSKQLLARSNDANVQVWATLTDGTPLVSARRQGEGLLILIHSSADPSWSDLPLSGLFEGMLVRMLPLADNADALDISAEAPWRLDRALTFEGRLAPPESPAEIAADAWNEAAASPETPPGIYASGDARRALNLTTLTGPAFAFSPLKTDGLRPAETSIPPIDLGRWLMLAAALLFAVDVIVTLILRGAISLPAARLTSSTAAVVMALIMTSPLAAQETNGRLQLAYIGGTAQDAEIASGLQALSAALSRRTAVDAGIPARVSPGDQGLGRYPVIYWPAAARQSMNRAEAANIRAYLSRGGMILFDFGQPLGNGSGARRLLAPLGLPSLQEVTRDHVLFRSYYLIDQAGGGALWVEADTEGDSGRVAGVLIGGGNWPALWAGSSAVSAVRREAALRFGINAVMYALTGTYKADQVHTETLLDRIGE